MSLKQSKRRGRGVTQEEAVTIWKCLETLHELLTSDKMVIIEKNDETARPVEAV